MNESSIKNRSSDMRESSASAPSCPVLSINRDLDPADTAEDISRDRRV